MPLAHPAMGPQYWTDAAENIVIQALRPFKHQSTMVIDEAVLHSYAEEYQVEPVWIMIAERNTWPQGDNNGTGFARSLGVDTPIREHHAATLADAEERVAKSLRAELLHIKAASPQPNVSREARAELDKMETIR